jgi:endonuclease III
MQVVLLRIMPNAPFRDNAQARDMLSSFLKEPRVRASELQPFALLLHNMLTEQQQKDAEIQAQAQKLKEETKRYDAVKQKLDALIDAERKMLERNKPVRAQ